VIRNSRYVGFGAWPHPGRDRVGDAYRWFITANIRCLFEALLNQNLQWLCEALLSKKKSQVACATWLEFCLLALLEN
jgi:hypothetical protein